MTMETIRLIEHARNLSDSEWEQFKQKLVKEVESTGLEKRVSNLLIQLGVPMKNRGFKYLKEAIIISLKNPKVLDGITKRLYPAIAKEFDTTWERVERCIRSAIEYAFRKGNMRKIHEIFKDTYSVDKGKTTNLEFLVGIVEYIKIS